MRVSMCADASVCGRTLNTSISASSRATHTTLHSGRAHFLLTLYILSPGCRNFRDGTSMHLTQPAATKNPLASFTVEFSILLASTARARATSSSFFRRSFAERSLSYRANTLACLARTFPVKKRSGIPPESSSATPGKPKK